MPDEVKKYEFRNEDERIVAIEALPDDPPPGVDVQEWQDEQASILDTIQKVELLPEGQEPSKDKEKTPEELAAEAAAAKGGEGDSQSTTAEQDAVRRHNEALRNDMEKMKHDSDEKLLKMQRDYEKKLEELKPPEQTLIEDSETDKRIKEVRADIVMKNEKMNTISDKFDNDEYFNLSHSVQQLQSELIDLGEKRHKDTINIVKEFKTSAEADAKLRTEQAEKERNKELSDNQRSKFLDKMSTFRGEHDELKGKEYNDLEQDYIKFGREIGSIYFQKPAIDVGEKEMEQAMAKYAAKAPHIMDGVISRGVKEPDGLSQFMLLSNVAMAMDGYELDANTGTWTNLINPNGNKVIMASFEDAYSYIKRKSGQTGQEIIDKQKEAIENYNNASQQRADVTELGSEHQQREIDDMEKEEAQRILAMTGDEDIVMRKRRNPSDPGVIQYEKAAKLLGFDPIPV